MEMPAHLQHNQKKQIDDVNSVGAVHPIETQGIPYENNIQGCGNLFDVVPRLRRIGSAG
jgi:hypothetical protein